MKSTILYFIFILLTFQALAQKYDIKGIITDTSGTPLIFATVMLMDMDSILLDFAQTDNKGSFIFKSIRKNNCIIKTSYLGYFPVTINITPEKKPIIDLGIIKMEEIAKELMEVVIKTAKAPLKLRGDTVEYDISQFKVPQGATL